MSTIMLTVTTHQGRNNEIPYSASQLVEAKLIISRVGEVVGKLVL